MTNYYTLLILIYWKNVVNNWPLPQHLTLTQIADGEYIYINIHNYWSPSVRSFGTVYLRSPSIFVFLKISMELDIHNIRTATGPFFRFRVAGSSSGAVCRKKIHFIYGFLAFLDYLEQFFFFFAPILCGEKYLEIFSKNFSTKFFVWAKISIFGTFRPFGSTTKKIPYVTWGEKISRHLEFFRKFSIFFCLKYRFFAFLDHS